MINKQEGIINNIIYDNTVYHNGEYRFYPSLLDLKGIVKAIIQSRSTTINIKFTPFYINGKLERQVEFDEYMFYMECRDRVSESVYEGFLQECIDGDLYGLSKDKLEGLKKQYVLCENTDVNKFKEGLEVYIEYLNILIPRMVDELINEYKVNKDDLLFGYFCFEIESE